MSKSQFLAESDKFTAWCKSALKFWAETAKDPRGGYAEHLHMDGKPDFDHVRRVRVQSRQAYVYAHAGDLGWFDGAKAASDQAWNFATGAGSAGGQFIPTPERGCAHLVEGNGKIHDDMRDTYAQAFILLAGAWRYRAFNDMSSLHIAEATLRFLNKNVKANNGGWLEALPKPTSLQRRQNPHMHLFEAFIALHVATENEIYLSLANDMFELFENHFFDPESGVLLEYFNSDWSPEGDGGPTEPGHMMEWVWLLHCYSEISGRDMRQYMTTLYDNAIKYGWNDKLGLICDSVNIDGSPHSPTLRTWPQTELLKASIARAEADGSDEMYQAAAETIDALFRYYLSVPIEGGWADKLSSEGEIISTVMPTSTFYHLFCAAAEADKLARRIRVQVI